MILSRIIDHVRQTISRPWREPSNECIHTTFDAGFDQVGNIYSLDHYRERKRVQQALRSK